MRPLARHLARATALATLVVLAVSWAAGTVRLLPWLMSPVVPLRVVVPFAEALVALGFETAVIVGMPIGCAFAAARFVDRGEARALLGLGVSHHSLIVRAAAPVLLLGSLGFLVGVCLDADASRPGRMARELIAAGAGGCDKTAKPSAVPVPLVGTTWLCFSGEQPRVLGEIPGGNRRAWYTAQELVPSVDLTSVELRNVQLVMRPVHGSYGIVAHFTNATVRGMSPWGRPAQLPVLWRSALVSAAATSTSLLVAWLVLKMFIESRLLALLIGAIPAVAGWALWHVVDRSAESRLAYAAIPLGELLVLAGIFAIGTLRPRFRWLVLLCKRN